MGRKKSYDPEVVLDRAMRLFWERGFHATSTRELTEAMGVNVYSLYAEFGSKEGLYEAALKRYLELELARRLAPIRSGRPGLDELREALSSWVVPGLGCMLSNGLAEGAPLGELAQSWPGSLTRELEAALRSARSRGQLRSRAPVERLAASLTASLLGLFALQRAGAERSLGEAVVHQAMAGVEVYSVQRSSY